MGSVGQLDPLVTFGLYRCRDKQTNRQRACTRKWTCEVINVYRVTFYTYNYIMEVTRFDPRVVLPIGQPLNGYRPKAPPDVGRKTQSRLREFGCQTVGFRNRK